MAKHIFLRQVVAEMERVDEKGKPVQFDVDVYTYNRNNKSGGDLKKYRGVRLLITKKLEGKKFDKNTHLYRVSRDRKNPNHWDNATRNIETESGMVRKIKLRYIKRFNGLDMIY